MSISCRWSECRACNIISYPGSSTSGAMGVVVPFVSSEQQAREIVASAKYPPEGRRGVAFGVAHDGYRAGNLVTKMRRANEEIMLIAQIENTDGVEHASRIAAVDGIDALWIGQYDLSTSLGIPGRFDHRFFQEATQKVVEACRKHGKAAVLGATTPKLWLTARPTVFACLSTSPISGSTRKVCVIASE